MKVKIVAAIITVVGLAAVGLALLPQLSAAERASCGKRAKGTKAKDKNNAIAVDVVLEEVDLAANTISARATTYLVPPHGGVGGAVFSMGTLDTPDKDKATRLVRLPVMPEAKLKGKGLQAGAHAVLHLSASRQGTLVVVGIDRSSELERIGVDWLDAPRTKDKKTELGDQHDVLRE
jgi:hypothetical protein